MYVFYKFLRLPYYIAFEIFTIYYFRLESSIATNISASDFIVRQQGRLRDFYRIGKVLGTGAFGEVR